MREREFIEWIQAQSKFDRARVPVGPGDDCAIVTFGGEQVLITTDQVLDGVHFVLCEHGPRAAGRKAMARNLSDIAAMGAVPVAAVATVSLPKGFAREDAEAIYTGLREVGDKFACPLVGGDVGVWDGPLAISVTVFGRPADRADPILRSGAQPGDALCVTGELGGAWRTRRHLEFCPRIDEAVQLVRDYDLHAMIDISDGLATDLDNICRASAVAAEIYADRVPIHSDARRFSGDDEAVLAFALGDGEDYELLFALPQEQAEKLCRQQPLSIKVTIIGCVLGGEGITLVYPDGRREPMSPSGWEHKT